MFIVVFVFKPLPKIQFWNYDVVNADKAGRSDSLNHKGIMESCRSTSAQIVVCHVKSCPKACLGRLYCVQQLTLFVHILSPHYRGGMLRRVNPIKMCHADI